MTMHRPSNVDDPSAVVLGGGHWRWLKKRDFARFGPSIPEP